MQFKGEGSGYGAFGIGWHHGKIGFEKADSQVYGSVNAPDVWLSPTATVRDQWLKILVHVKWSTSSDGFYELFGDLADGQGFRQLKARTNGWTLKYAANGGPVAIGARIGIYRQALSTGVTAYYDGFNVAATRADATLRGFGMSQ